MKFDPANHIVQLCLHALSLEETGNREAALNQFSEGWNLASNDFEKFITSFYIARFQQNTTERLNWLNTTLQLGYTINDDTVKSAFPGLYLNIAKCYEESGNTELANEYYKSAREWQNKPSDSGPFYHGTKADLQIGDLLTAGGDSNYKQGLKMNHIYFTALVNGAGLAAALAKGDGPERIYIVEPIGEFENDPNVTDKKFPGNQTRSYRSTSPLKITGEATEWERITPEALQKWRDKLSVNNGEIIN